jgi:hypothetical protein
MTYRNAQNKEEKREMEKLIAQIKNDFESDVAANDKRVIKLNKVKGELFALTTQTTLFDRTKAEKISWDKQVKTLTDTIFNLETELEGIRSNKIYENAFEWRFEFPEVLNEEGDFVGFDVVIGNPPYVSAWDMFVNNEDIRGFLIQRFNKDNNLLKGHWDLYMAFILLSLDVSKSCGYCTYIIPNPFLREKYAAPLREYMLKETNLMEITLFEDNNVFDDVARRTIIYLLSKNTFINDFVNINLTDSISYRVVSNGKILKKEWAKSSDFRFNVNADVLVFDLINKIELMSEKLGNICYINYGAQVSSKEKGGFKKSAVVFKEEIGKAKKFIEGKDVHRWSLNYRNLWLDYRAEEMYGARFSELFENQKIVFRKISDRGHRIAATIDVSNFYTDDGCVLAIPYSNLTSVLEDDSYFGFERKPYNCELNFLLAQILSKVTTFYFKNKFSTESLQGETSHTYPKSVRQLPIIMLERSFQQPYIDIVSEIFIAKQKGDDTTALESEIDRLVYQLYDLTDEEIKIVEGRV